MIGMKPDLPPSVGVDQINNWRMIGFRPRMPIIQWESEVEDQRLLRQFIEEGSQAAFACLVERHRNLVYSTCRRELGDSSLAEDAAQVVFLLLARKARSLRREVVLSGWLFQAARFTAKDLRQREVQRRMRDEKIGVEMLDRQQQECDAVWQEIDPWLHESLGRLGEKDRLVILMRFFEGMNFSEIALALGQKEDAARHRLNRALEKMRRVLVSKGVVIPAAALGALLAANAVHPASGSVAPITTGSFDGPNFVSPHLQQLTTGVLQAMRIKQLITAGTAAVFIAATVGAGAELAKNAHSRVGAPASLPARAAAAHPSKTIIGTWVGHNQGYPKETTVYQYNPDGTFRQLLNAAGTAFCTGHYMVKGNVLALSPENLVVNGKSTPVAPQNMGAAVAKISFQGGAIVLDENSRSGIPFQTIMVAQTVKALPK